MDKWIEAYNREYLFNGRDLTIEECKGYLKHHKNDKDDFSDLRYERVNNKLKQLKAARSAMTAEQKFNEELAWEYVRMTEEWESQGATFICRETITTWSINGVPFYSWISGDHIQKTIHKAREAHNIFLRMTSISKTVTRVEPLEREDGQMRLF